MQTTCTCQLNVMPRTAVVACRVLEAEIVHFAKGLSNLIHIEWVEQGLHEEPNKLREKLQELVARVEDQTSAEVIVLGYGLCSRGTEGVTTRRARLVIARAHDCITHLLGSKEKYAEYTKNNHGTYWYSPGWNKYAPMPGQERYEKLYKDYVEKYGEDNAQYLMDSEQNWFKSYHQATYVDLGVGGTDENLCYTQKCAKWLGWKCDHVKGDPSLVKALLAGPWDEERFVMLEPGQTFRMTGDERVIEAIKNEK